MSRCLLLLSLVVCTVYSQVCSPPILPPPCLPPCIPTPCQTIIPPCPTIAPQVINPNPCVTTIIDSSVSNALVNALQLLIVSNIIGSTVGPSAPLLNSLGPLLDSIVRSNSAVEIIPEYGLPYVPEYVIPPYGPLPTCGPYLLPPVSPITTCSTYYDIIPPCAPVNYPSYEIISPCGNIIDPYIPLCGLNDVYPNYFYTETVTPFYIDSLPYGDLLFPLPGIETICPNPCGGLTEIIPYYINYPIPEICPVNPYCGGFETIPPAPPMFNCLNEVVPPFGPVRVSNYYGGLPEMTSEVIIPSPTPMNSNYGYCPSNLPCVKIMEPLVNENCVYNYGGPIYY